MVCGGGVGAWGQVVGGGWWGRGARTYRDEQAPGQHHQDRVMYHGLLEVGERCAAFARIHPNTFQITQITQSTPVSRRFSTRLAIGVAAGVVSGGGGRRQAERRRMLAGHSILPRGGNRISCFGGS